MRGPRLAAAFRMTNDESKRWKKEFSWLFALRDSAVHHREALRPIAPHPIDGQGSPLAAEYCVETSIRAVELLGEVLRVLASQNRAKTETVRRYSESVAGGVDAALKVPIS
jgi:hypothetical protein